MCHQKQGNKSNNNNKNSEIVSKKFIHNKRNTQQN